MQPIHVKANLTKNKHTLLNKLKKDPSMVIRGADKGSCVVVENTPDYIKNGLEHLADTSVVDPGGVLRIFTNPPSRQN